MAASLWQAIESVMIGMLSKGGADIDVNNSKGAVGYVLLRLHGDVPMR